MGQGSHKDYGFVYTEQNRSNPIPIPLFQKFFEVGVWGRNFFSKKVSPPLSFFGNPLDKRYYVWYSIIRKEVLAWIYR